MSAKNNDYRYVLAEAVESLIEKARDVDSQGEYDAGRRMAYFEILQAIQDVADEVGIDKGEIGLDKFDHGSLIGLRKTA